MVMHYRMSHTFITACGLKPVPFGITWTSHDTDVTCLDCRRELGMVVDDVALMDIAVKAFGLMAREEQRKVLVAFALAFRAAGAFWNPDVEFPNAVQKVVQDGR